MRNTPVRFYRQPLAGLALLLLATTAVADERVLLLEDGSQIRGELISYEQGTYTIRTESLGTVKLADQNVRQVSAVKTFGPTAIEAPSAASPLEENLSNRFDNGSIEALQSAIMSSPSLMSSITSLQADPQVQALLADPEILRAVQNLDFDSLSRNAKIQALMDNPKVKALQRDIGADQ